jgi:hypothetical protein
MCADVCLFGRHGLSNLVALAVTLNGPHHCPHIRRGIRQRLAAGNAPTASPTNQQGRYHKGRNGVEQRKLGFGCGPPTPVKCAFSCLRRGQWCPGW